MKNKMIKIVIGVMLFTGVIAFHPLHVLAIDCTVPASGNLSISSSCIFPGTINGADAGTGTTNTASVTVSNGATLTIAADQTIAVGSLIPSGGSVAIITGGQIKIGSPLWMTDADSDGYPSAATQVVQASVPTNGRRRSLMASLTSLDCNDGSNSPTNTCCTIATRYQDSDGDTYGNPSISISACPTAGYVDNNTDCNDANVAIYPGTCSSNTACTAGGATVTCSTAGTCQTGGGCSGGSCVGVSNAAAGTDPNNQCTPAPFTVYNAATNLTCLQVCSQNSITGNNCNGSGSCSTAAATCTNFGNDGAGTNGNWCTYYTVNPEWSYCSAPILCTNGGYTAYSCQYRCERWAADDGRGTTYPYYRYMTCRCQ